MADNEINSTVLADEYATWLIQNKDQKGSEEFRQVAELYNQAKDNEKKETVTPLTVPEPDPRDKLGFWAGVGESITGNLRETPEVLTLPKAGKLPELNLFTTTDIPAAFKTALFTAMGDTQEMANIIKKQFPDVRVRYDSKNNPILRSSIDNKEYIIAPGFDLGDIFRGAEAAAVLGSTRGKSLLGIGAQAGASQGAFEIGQSLTGGEIDLGDIAGATVGAPLVTGVLNLGRLGYNKYLSRFFNKEAPPLIDTPILSDEEIIDIARRAANGDERAKAMLAEMGAPDEITLAAARRLGIEEYLQPDHMASDLVYIQIAQAAKSEAASAMGAKEREGLEKVAERAVNLIDELGGTPDLSMLNRSVFNRLKSTVDELSKRENAAWTALREVVSPEGQPPLRTNPERILRYLDKRLTAVGGEVDNLLPIEQKLYKALSPTEVTGTIGGDTIVLDTVGPTYTLLDQWRRQVGRGIKYQGEFAKEDQGALNILYGLLRGDVEDAATAAGAQKLFNEAVDTSRVLGAFEKDMVSLFSADLSKSLIPVINGAMDAMSKGQANKFIALMEAIPPEMRRQVAISAITSTFTKGVKDQSFNFNNYMNWYGGLLRNREAKVVLDRALGPEARQMFNALYVVSRGVQRSDAEKLRTGRPRTIVEAMNNADRFISRLFEATKRAAIGAPIEAVTTSIGVPGAGASAAVTYAVTASTTKKESVRNLATLMMSSEFQNMIQQAGTAQERAAARELANTAPFRRFMEEIKMPPDRWMEFILGGTQAATQAPLRSGVYGMESPQQEDQEPTPAPAPPPQARVQPPAPPARGVPGMGGTTTPAPGPVAQGPQVASQPSREMLKSLFPFDTTIA